MHHIKQRLSYFLGISILAFGGLKFVEPFSGWYSRQISLSGMPNEAYWLGIFGEIFIGLFLIWGTQSWHPIPNLKLRASLLLLASGGLAVTMAVATWVHLHPQVPAEVLPLKIKPPIIPLVFLVGSFLNIWFILNRFGGTTNHFETLLKKLSRY